MDIALSMENKSPCRLIPPGTDPYKLQEKKMSLNRNFSK